MTVVTERQAAVLRICVRDESTNEGAVRDELWPLVRRSRPILNALCERGLVVIDYWDDEVGYEFTPTAAGRAVVREQGGAT